MMTCEWCHGAGVVIAPQKLKCAACEGSGRILAGTCPACDGHGYAVVTTEIICDLCDGAGMRRTDQSLQYSDPRD
jgi:DnaJ-class molecular chaperone